MRQTSFLPLVPSLAAWESGADAIEQMQCITEWYAHDQTQAAVAPREHVSNYRDSDEEELARPGGEEKLVRSSGEEKLARPSGEEKLARPSGEEKLARSSGIEKLARSSGEETTAASALSPRLAPPRAMRRTAARA